VFDTEKEIDIGSQPNAIELLGIRQGFGSLFWHCGKAHIYVV
jgi:hypothetical protein